MDHLLSSLWPFQYKTNPNFDAFSLRVDAYRRPSHHNFYRYHRIVRNVQLDQYIAMDYSQQKTSNESQDSGLLRVAHPQHPLNGEIVKVRKREGRHWVIERPDGSLEKLPLAWAETISPIIAPAIHAGVTPVNCAGVVALAESVEAWVGVTELLNLVTMIKRLRVQPPEEVANERQPGNNHEANQSTAREPDPGGEPHPNMGANSGGETSGIDPDFGRDAAEAAPGGGDTA
jgi:hypothetical protein